MSRRFSIRPLVRSVAIGFAVSTLPSSLSAAQPLKDGGPEKAGGANVEGIALWENRMYLGFRGPSVGNKAFILSAPESEVFAKSDDALVATDHEVELGARAGIRDLAAVS